MNSYKDFFQWNVYIHMEIEEWNMHRKCFFFIANICIVTIFGRLRLRSVAAAALENYHEKTPAKENIAGNSGEEISAGRDEKKIFFYTSGYLLIILIKAKMPPRIFRCIFSPQHRDAAPRDLKINIWTGSLTRLNFSICNPWFLY